jgi:signal transduction histidine kinase
VADPTAKYGTEVIKRQLKHMTRLLNDLLDVSRISTGKIKLDRQPIELADIIGAAIESSQPLIERYGHTLEVHLPSEPILLNVDAERLTQVFANLLNNAIKYTKPHGSIAIGAERRENRLAVWVKDSGIGIAEDKLPHVFEMFYQASGATEQASGGLGIGLSLAKELVELHGGSLQAFSDGVGKGSEFQVTLPS